MELEKASNGDAEQSMTHRLRNLAPANWGEADLKALQVRIATGLEQARSGDFAEGDGEQAVRRAFAAARMRRQGITTGQRSGRLTGGG